MPLAPLDPAAVREALIERGFEPGRAHAAARGLAPTALLIEALPSQHRDLLLDGARRLGLHWVSGDDWIPLAGGRARLAELVRPGGASLPRDLGDPLGYLLQPETRCWSMRRGTISLERPVVAGILNITPDSFSDGGLYLAPDDALRHADALLEAGADLLDLGAESTRPGRPVPVPADEEWRRLEPVLAALVRRHPNRPISVDTVKAETARRALDAGAWAINDVSGLRLDPEIADVCARHDAGFILMHSRGGVEDMATYEHAGYRSVTAAVVDELHQALETARERGVAPERIVLDPGLGFAKRPEHNYRLLRDLPAVAALGRPVMVGPSRKRFLGAVTGRATGERDQATAAVCVAAHLLGARLFRVHAPAPVREALTIAHAVEAR